MLQKGEKAAVHWFSGRPAPAQGGRWRLEGREELGSGSTWRGKHGRRERERRGCIRDKFQVRSDQGDGSRADGRADGERGRRPGERDECVCVWRASVCGRAGGEATAGDIQAVAGEGEGLGEGGLAEREQGGDEQQSNEKTGRVNVRSILPLPFRAVNAGL